MCRDLPELTSVPSRGCVPFAELIAAGADLTYAFHEVNIMKNESKDPWFLKLNPNGRIPTIVDNARDGFAVWESASILLYIQKHYDSKRLLGFTDENLDSEMMTWIFFQHVSQSVQNR